MGLFGTSNPEARMLAKCAAEGFEVLDRHFRHCHAEGYAHLPFVANPTDASGKLEGHATSGNLDLFYAGLSVLHSLPDRQPAHGLLKAGRSEDARSDLDRMITCVHGGHREGVFERRLADNVRRYSDAGDEGIRQEFSRRFAVSRLDLTDLPTDRSIYFAKVNHGYWEYMRSAYDDAPATDERFREIDVQSKVRRLRTSDVTQFWGRQIRTALSQGVSWSERASVSFCISLTAGTEPPAISIRKEFSPVTRGAAVGLMAMFEATLPEQDRYSLGDGSATRSLVFQRKLAKFFDKYVADSEACLLVVPPHLRQVDLVGYQGQVYQFLVPPTQINETWKTVAATLLGYLGRLGQRHKTITLLGQGASIASLMALLFAEIDPLPDVRLRYFDLGRVLDIAAPEFLAKQAWAKRHTDAYVAEGRKVFRQRSEPGAKLATML